jgi:hypothetical protein
MRLRVTILLGLGLSVGSGCSPDPIPSTQGLRLAWRGKELPKPRATASDKLIQELAEKLQSSVQSQREFRHWSCDVGSHRRLKDEGDGFYYLSCALAGFHQPRVFLRDMNVAAKSNAGMALTRVDHRERISLSGAFDEGRQHWASVTVENCGLDLEIPAESAVFIAVDVEVVKP